MVKKTLDKFKSQLSLVSPSRKDPKIPKPFITCKYCLMNPLTVIKGSLLTRNQGLLISDPLNPLKNNGCSRHKTWVKQYLHRYLKESGLKVVFGDNSTGDTEGNGSVNRHFGIYSLRGTIFNQNNEFVLIDPMRREVYVIDMSSYNQESNTCFFAKASHSANWLRHKRLSHLNFKNINKLAKQNLVAVLPSLTFSKDKPCSTYENGNHHRAPFKSKRSFSINKCLHLLHMDLFGPITPQTMSHNKYTLVIVDEHARKMENLNEVRINEL
ncbi:retrovirus-related pol polyprotein from transposon TNT 1-94 [Tanacetum coccineum]